VCSSDLKSDSPDPVAPDEQITYTITVKNDADTNGVCDGFEVTDTIPDNTECVSIDVTDDDAAAVDEDTGDSDCDDAGEGDEVGWDSTDDLNDGDSVVLKLVVELTSGADDGDTIENEACATSGDDEQGGCDTEKTKVDEDAATATPVATATTVAVPTVRPVGPPVVAPPPPAPSAGQAPTLVAPLTGTGTAAGGPLPLALALGLAGGCLLLLGGVAMLRRPR
jgi:fimbrial isopeptide formation D2 family protein